MIRLLAFSLFVAVVSPSPSATQELPRWHPDDHVYNEIARVRGHVLLLNHPTLGKAPARSTYLVFQRQGCRQCLVATWTDQDGNYELFLGRGRYKLIVRDGRGGPTPSKDMIAASQQRVLQIDRRDRDVTFDIELALPAD